MSEKWHRRFLDLAIMISAWSKDPSTKTGAVIISDIVRRIPLSFGYNGFPRGVSEDAARFERPQKYLYTEHAERNAIYNARSPLDGAILYTTHAPCCDCARSIIQSGIKSVVTFDDENLKNWDEHQNIGQIMLREASVKIVRIARGKG